MSRITRYYVIMDVEGDPDDAYTAIDGQLEAGAFQDAINEAHQWRDDAKPVSVKMAIVRTDPADIPESVSTCGKCGGEYPDPYGDADCPKCHGGRRP